MLMDFVGLFKIWFTFSALIIIKTTKPIAIKGSRAMLVCAASNPKSGGKNVVPEYATAI